MVRTFPVRLNAAHPELPLMEASAIVGSPSTAFISRVPATVGTWTITKVYAQAEYPDGTITTVEAARSAEGIWTATLPATQTSGRVKCGFSILADGIDENDEPVTGYTLGIADMAVYTRDLKVVPGFNGVAMHYFDAAPAFPKKGDVAPMDGVVKMYDGTQWVAFGSEVDLSDYYTKEETDEAIEAVAAYYITADAQGSAFATYSALVNAETYYSGGVARTLTRNDYAVVLADETHDGAEYRYIYAIADGASQGQWEAQYPIETNDYLQLDNKPSINSITLTGDKTAADLGLATIDDATLTYANLWVWTNVPSSVTVGQPVYEEARSEWTIPAVIEGESTTMYLDDSVPPTATVLDVPVTVSGEVVTMVATLTAQDYYVLGSQTDKPLATEAEAAALRTAVDGKLSKAGDTMTGGLTVPNLTVGSRDSQYQVGTGSTAEGENVSAVGMYCHAEGTNTYSSGYASHAEGFHTTATTNTGTHAEGCLTTALGEGSHAEGGNTETKNEYEHAEGRYNNSHRDADYNWGGAGNTLSATGFGSSENAKKNAVETMQDGKTYIYGIGGYDGTNPNTTGVKDLATAVNDKADKATSPTAGNIATLTATGGLADGGVDVATTLRYALGTTITASSVMADRTCNSVIAAANNTADILLSFPPATTGKARDFVTLITNNTGNTGDITFVMPSGATVYGDAFTTPCGSGETWLYSFTEVAPNKFFSKAQQAIDPFAPKYWGLYFEAEEDGVVINMTRAGVSVPTTTLETSTDGETWTTFDTTGSGTTPITLANVGDRVYFRAGSGGNTYFGSANQYGHTFTISKRCGAHGNIMSLLDANGENLTTLTDGNTFCRLFDGCTKLTSAPALPATALKAYCYYYMFNGCTSLVTPPELPATNLYPYQDPASACYQGMFSGCTSLEIAPALPATTLSPNCYNEMFQNCSALTYAPDLPATSRAQNCYNAMYYNCSSLSRIHIAFTSWGYNGEVNNWVFGVAASGTLYCPAALGTNETIDRSVNRCPANWTVVNI